MTRKNIWCHVGVCVWELVELVTFELLTLFRSTSTHALRDHWCRNLGYTTIIEEYSWSSQTVKSSASVLYRSLCSVAKGSRLSHTTTCIQHHTEISFLHVFHGCALNIATN